MLEVNVAEEAPKQTTAAGKKGSSYWPYAALLAFLGLVWWQAVHHLQGEWSYNPQYSYGWSVPLLIIYLFYRRWTERPAPDRPNLAIFAGVALAAGALCLLPIRFLAEANPDWRLLSMALGFITVALSLAVVYLAGGWSWLRYFAFPIFFFLVAVPWPTQFEQNVIQNLMRLVSALNVVIVNAIGIPAVQHGNVIEVSTGMIGIEEACSGVRSLQATFMIALFLGELFSFRVLYRVLLVVAGMGLALLCNLARTIFLVVIGAREGLHAIEGWHDPAGFTILLVCLIALWLICIATQRFARAPDRTNISDAAPMPLPTALFAALAAWLIAAELGVKAWYDKHQSAMSLARWSVQWPENSTGYKAVEVAPAARNLLRYDDGGGASWTAAEDRRWMLFFFKWLPGHTAALFVKVHRPDICLPASGMTMEKDNGIRLVRVNDVNLPIRSYRFSDHGAPMHVFYCYWDARSSYETESAANEEDWSARGRIRAAIRGRREIGAQMLEVAVWGYEQDADAEAALEKQLQEIVKKG